MSIREAKHRFCESCRCRLCFAVILGQWIFDIGKTTAPGKWQIFGTITFRPRPDMWRKGFPSSLETSSGFAHRLFDRFIVFLELELHTTVDYVSADQLGFIGGKFHLHFLLSAAGLDRFPFVRIEHWLRSRAGWSRILPVKHGAERYLSRFIGSNPEGTNWVVRVGETKTPAGPPPIVGRRLVVRSAELARSFFRSQRKRR